MLVATTADNHLIRFHAHSPQLGRIGLLKRYDVTGLAAWQG